MRPVLPAELSAATPDDGTVVDDRGARTGAAVDTAAAPHRSRWLLFACEAALIAAILGATVFLAFDMRRRAIDDAKRELENVGLILADQTALSLRTVELVQTNVIERIRTLGIETPADLGRMSGHVVHGLLADKIRDLPQIDALAIVGVDGRLVNTSGPEPILPPDVSESEYARASRADPQSATVMGEPVRNGSTGTWSIHLARKIAAADGGFVGVVLGTVKTSQFQRQFAGISLGADAAVTLLRDDGVLLARYPNVEGTIGSRFADLVSALRHAGPVVHQRVSDIDGRDRYIASRPVPGFPAIVAVSVPVEAAAGGAEAYALILLVVGSALAISVGAILALMARRSAADHDEAERAQARQTRQLDAALKSMSHGLVIFDPDGRVVLVNDRYRDMYGLTRGAVRKGCDMLSLAEARRAAAGFPADPVQYCVDVMTDIAHGGSDVTEDMPDGRTIYIVNRPIDGGGWVATHEDITERRRAEKQRDRNRDLLDRVIENVPTMIVVKDARDLRYVLVNREAERRLGLDEGNSSGRRSREVFPLELARQLEDDDRAVLDSRQISVVPEQELRTAANEPATIRITRVPILGNDGEPLYLLVVAEDLTERKSMERQLHQVMKMEAIGNLTGGIAHDFNNLLMVMIGNLDLLAEEVVGQPSAREKVDTILQAATHGAELTRQMLAFARRQPLNPKRIDMGELLMATAKMLARTLGADITIDLRLSEDLWPVRVDEAQLQSSIVNIAINARDAMPGGGTAVIAARNIVVADADAELRPHLAGGDYVEIAIEDSGQGMSAELLGRVFEPFFTTKPQGRGTGLGLSMVYGFAKQSGGHVAITSEVGRGTTVHIFLPRTVSEQKAQAAVATVDARGKGEIVLAVDDNKDVLATVCRQLDDLGYNVISAGSAFSALRLLGSGVKVDLLFSDIVMPGGLNGTELADEVREKHPGIKILLTSGFADAFGDTDDVLHARYNLLTKPYRKQDLAVAVRRVIDDAPPLAPE